jgi:hypothetical protein
MINEAILSTMIWTTWENGGEMKILGSAELRTSEQMNCFAAARK